MLLRNKVPKVPEKIFEFSTFSEGLGWFSLFFRKKKLIPFFFSQAFMCNNFIHLFRPFPGWFHYFPEKGSHSIFFLFLVFSERSKFEFRVLSFQILSFWESIIQCWLKLDLALNLDSSLQKSGVNKEKPLSRHGIFQCTTDSEWIGSKTGRFSKTYSESMS